MTQVKALAAQVRSRDCQEEQMARDTLLEAGYATGLRSEVAALTELDAQARARRELERAEEETAFRVTRQADQERQLERMRAHLATRTMRGGIAQVSRS